MKKYTLFIIVTVITIIASFPLVSCSGGTAATPTAPPATALTTTAPAAPAPAQTAATTPVAVLPTTAAATPTPTPTPTPTTTIPVVTPDLPDLAPYLIDGKSAVTVDNSSQDFKKILIKAGVSNIGKLPATNVAVDLYNSNTKIYSWNIGSIAPGENKVLEVTVENILKQSSISAGRFSLNINCSLAGGGQENTANNKSASYTLLVAPAPVERRASQSNVEKMIQDSIDKSTWYTASNQGDLLTILKEVLKDANIMWTTLHLEIDPSSKFNDTYANTFGKTDAEKQQLKRAFDSYIIPGIGFSYGTNVNTNIVIREGTIMQVLPPLMKEIGEVNYFYINYGAYNNGVKVYSPSLAGTLMEAYGIRVMREKYGLGGLTNMSANLNTVPHPSLTGTGPSSVNLRRMWAIAADAGYPNGDTPSDKLYRAYLTLTQKTDPVAYMADLDKKGDAIDKAAIENIIRWRLSNKELTALPADIVQKIDPGNSAQSLDIVISNQEFVAFP
jgi:hypothetical protein